MGAVCRDSKIMGGGKTDPLASNILGNYIVIRHAEHEHSMLAHLQFDSIWAELGSKVTRGQKIARCGNTGNSTEPHLHFGLQSKKGFLGDGLPIHFTDICAEPYPNYAEIDPRPTETIENTDTTFITRGMIVWNDGD
ncbi:MAG: M23 family metallopeptidase [Oscillospiraceae bacterium]|nr:M23 family metallopeptidase [Oscillospiraceae bacterium]